MFLFESAETLCKCWRRHRHRKGVLEERGLRLENLYIGDRVGKHSTNWIGVKLFSSVVVVHIFSVNISSRARSGPDRIKPLKEKRKEKEKKVGMDGKADGRITAGWVLMFDPQPHTPAYFQELTPRAVISCARLPFLKMFFASLCAQFRCIYLPHYLGSFISCPYCSSG